MTSLSDDELTALLARHSPEPDWQSEYDNCGGCTGAWPCETVRLATEVRDLRAVKDAAKEGVETMPGGADRSACHTGLTTRQNCVYCRPKDALTAALARYEEGGR